MSLQNAQAIRVHPVTYSRVHLIPLIFTFNASPHIYHYADPRLRKEANIVTAAKELIIQLRDYDLHNL